MSIQTWLEGVIKDAVTSVLSTELDAIKEEILTEIQAAENNITAQVTSLPGLVGSQIQNVAVDATAVAGKVVSGISGQLSQLPQQIIAGVLQGIPWPFKGGR